MIFLRYFTHFMTKKYAKSFLALKNWFWPANSMWSTRLLVEIHNKLLRLLLLVLLLLLLLLLILLQLLLLLIFLLLFCISSTSSSLRFVQSIDRTPIWQHLGTTKQQHGPDIKRKVMCLLDLGSPLDPFNKVEVVGWYVIEWASLVTVIGWDSTI